MKSFPGVFSAAGSLLHALLSRLPLVLPLKMRQLRKGCVAFSCLPRRSWLGSAAQVEALERNRVALSRAASLCARAAEAPVCTRASVFSRRWVHSAREEGSEEAESAEGLFARMQTWNRASVDSCAAPRPPSFAEREEFTSPAEGVVEGVAGERASLLRLLRMRVAGEPCLLAIRSSQAGLAVVV